MKIRKYLENTPKCDYKTVSSSLGVTDFPGGCCDDTSQVLATLIYDEFKVISKLFRGNSFKGHPDIKTHVWLEVEGLIVDITLDQFNEYDSNYNFPPVYVGKKLSFYNKFEITVKDDGRHYSGCAKEALKGIYAKIKNDIKCI